MEVLQYSAILILSFNAMYAYDFTIFLYISVHNVPSLFLKLTFNY